MEYTRSTRSGYTLTELLVVVAIIGVLAAIIIPVIAHVRNKGRMDALVVDVRRFQGIAQQGYPGGGAWPLTVCYEGGGVIGLPPIKPATLLYNGNVAQKGRATRLDQVWLSIGLIERLFDTPLVPNRLPSSWWIPARDPRWDPESGWFFNEPDAAVLHQWTECARAECGVVSNARTPGEVVTEGGGVDGSGTVDFKLDGVNRLTNGTRVQYLVLPGVASKDAYEIARRLNGDDMMDSLTPGSAQERGSAVYAAPDAGVTTLLIYLGNQ